MFEVTNSSFAMRIIKFQIASNIHISIDRLIKIYKIELILEKHIPRQIEYLKKMSLREWGPLQCNSNS